MKKMRGLFRIIFGRTAFVVLFMAIQVGILFGAFRWLEEYMHIVYAISILLSAVVIIYIFNEPINSSFKMAWIVPVLVIPVFGVLLYIFVQMQFQTKLLARRLKKNIGDTAPYLKQDEEVQERIREASRRSSHLIDYMKDHAGYPAYGNTHVEYFPLGEDKFEALMRELKAARHFIFMEYFIVERRRAWKSGLCMTACAVSCFFRTIIPECWEKKEFAVRCFRLSGPPCPPIRITGTTGRLWSLTAIRPLPEV